MAKSIAPSLFVAHPFLRPVLACLLLMAFVIGCARGQIRSPEQAMRPAKDEPSLADDLDFFGLMRALEANLAQIRKTSEPSLLRFGPVAVPRELYARAMEVLIAEGLADPSGERFRSFLRANFEPYEIYGTEAWGRVFMTSYYEPVIRGSKAPSGRFTQALYGLPRDLVTIDLRAFADRVPSLASLKGKVTEQRSQLGVLRGRLLAATADGETARVVPFPDREQIDSAGAIRGQGIELAFVDPIDAFFLQIQGSGVVRFDDGAELRVGYAGQNGHSYVAIGAFLKDVIPPKKLSLQTIESYLRSLPPAEAQKILNKNPSYVFFRRLSGAGITFFGTEVVPGRTVATDQTYFPKGALAFLEFDRPLFATAQDSEPREWRRSSRFVLDQDTGGAIRGPGRLDLFWGRGDEAKQHAGVVKNSGRLWYFVPKPELLARLSSGIARP